MSCDIDEEIRWLQDYIYTCQCIIQNPEASKSEIFECRLKMASTQLELEELEAMKKRRDLK